MSSLVEQTTTTISTGRYFSCHVDERGNIWASGPRGNEECIGVVGTRYQEIEGQLNEVLGKAEGYYQMLVEHKLIKPVLTPEEKMEAMQGEMQEMKGMLAQLLAEKLTQAQAASPSPVYTDEQLEAMTKPEAHNAQSEVSDAQ